MYLQIWENWSPEDDAVPDEDGEANGAAANGASTSTGAGERMSVTVTEVVDGTEFFIQVSARWISTNLPGPMPAAGKDSCTIHSLMPCAQKKLKQSVGMQNGHGHGESSTVGHIQPCEMSSSGLVKLMGTPSCSKRNSLYACSPANRYQQHNDQC